MKVWYRYFYEVVSLILFCAALTFLFMQQKQLTAGYRNMQKLAVEDKVLYKTEGEVIKTEAVEGNTKVTKPELVGILTAGLSYDVEIDGEYYKKEDFTPLLFEFDTLSSNYIKSYMFDKKDGRIVYIKYQKEGS